MSYNATIGAVHPAVAAFRNDSLGAGRRSSTKYNGVAISATLLASSALPMLTLVVF